MTGRRGEETLWRRRTRLYSAGLSETRTGRRGEDVALPTDWSEARTGRRGEETAQPNWQRRDDNGSARRGDWVGAARRLAGAGRGQVGTTRRSLGARLHVRGVACNFELLSFKTVMLHLYIITIDPSLYYFGITCPLHLRSMLSLLSLNISSITSRMVSLSTLSESK